MIPPEHPDVYVAVVGGGYLVMVRPHESGGHVAGPLLSTLAHAERDGARAIAALRARRVTPGPGGGRVQK
jgi:hypothetical protein